MRHIIVLLAAAGLAAVAAPAAAYFRPTEVLRIGVGYTAQTLCSQTFVVGRDPAEAFADMVKPVVPAVLAGPLAYRVDRETRTVEATWAGGFRMRSVHRGPAGCMVWRGDNAPPPTPAQPPRVTPLVSDWVSPASTPPAATSAIDRVFAQTREHVAAVVVIHRGRLVAERYAPDVRPDTPLAGNSLSKTVTAALIGRLVAQGAVDLQRPVGFPEWAGDARKAITPEHLLRMSSGLAAEETHSGFDFTSRMLFLSGDMSTYATSAKAKRAPGTRFAYQSPDTLLLWRLIRRSIGGGEAQALAFAHRELFGPLGMNSVVFETDAAGTPVGSMGVYATARDWAKLGQFYLDDGVAGGRRLLPEGFVDWAAEPTLDAPYGAGMWTNRGQASDHGMSRFARQGGMPADAYFASGFLGQRIMISPAEQLVVVRMGASSTRDQGMRGDVRLFRELAAAL